MATKLERLVAAGLITPEEAELEVVINVVNYLTEVEVDQLISIILKTVAFNDGVCPPPIDFRLANRQQAREQARARKEKARGRKNRRK